MKEFILRTDADAEALGNSILGAKITKPLLVTVKRYYGKRSWKQNTLQRLWMREAAEQLHEYTAEEYRGFCKLHFGVPILLEDEKFYEAYMSVVEPLPYELKLKLMCVPLDFPVTRLMNRKQKVEYLDLVYAHFTELGVELTEPKGERE